MHVRYGLCSQPLSTELVPPESAPVDQVDPAAASALHRLLVVHRVQPNLPASIDLRAFDRVEVCGPEAEARAAARAMILSATAFHNPDQLVVAVLSSEQNLTHWDWIKWLPHAQSAREVDAVGPMRLVTTSIDDLGNLLPPDLSDRPRFGADERPPTPHILLVIDGGHLPPGNHVVPPDGLHGVTLLDLPARWDELEDPTRLRLQFAEGRPPAGQGADPRDPGARGADQGAHRPVRHRDGRGLRPPAGAAQDRQRRRLQRGGRRHHLDDARPHGAARASATSTPTTPRPPGARARPATGSGCRSASATPAAWCTSTSRSPPSRAWARTAW